MAVQSGLFRVIGQSEFSQNSYRFRVVKSAEEVSFPFAAYASANVSLLVLHRQHTVLSSRVELYFLGGFVV